MQTVGGLVLSMNSSIPTLQRDGKILEESLKNISLMISNVQSMSGCNLSCQAINTSLLTMTLNYSLVGHHTLLIKLCLDSQAHPDISKLGGREVKTPAL